MILDANGQPYPVAKPKMKARRWDAAQTHRLNSATSEYHIYRRQLNEAKAPVWPDEVADVEQMLRLGFSGLGSGGVIDSLDHEIVRRLRGDL